jgi:hypothetical protein
VNLIRCNGCMTELMHAGDMDARRFFAGNTQYRRVVVEGRRVDGLSGSFGNTILRDGEEFHWCAKCTKIAFQAVENAR